MAIMQPQSLNPFPVSAEGDQPEKPVGTPPPMPTPAATPTTPTTPTLAPSSPKSDPSPTPKQAQALFVQPASAQHTTASLQPHGPLAPLESILLKLFSSNTIQLPEYVKDMVARMLPWLTIMMCVILAPLVLVGLGMGGFLGFITSFYEINTNPFYWLTLLLLIAQLALMAFAVPKLLRDARDGWYLLFIASVLGIMTLLANLFAQFVSPFAALISGIIVFAAVLYILFQTRSYYTS